MHSGRRSQFQVIRSPDSTARRGLLLPQDIEGELCLFDSRVQGGKPYASSGLFSFDGAGQVAILYTSSIERTQLFTTGTYTVDGNCSGSMTLAGATVVNHFYLSPTGDSFNFVRVSPDDVIGTEARRVSRKLIVKEP